MLAEQGFVLSEVDRVQPLGDVPSSFPHGSTHHDGPRETARSRSGALLGRPLWGRFDAFATPPRECLICAEATSQIDVKGT